MTNDAEDLEYKMRYREYIDRKYLELLQLNMDSPMSRIELLTLGATCQSIEDKELIVVKLPTHTDNPFVFYLDSESGSYFKW